MRTALISFVPAVLLLCGVAIGQEPQFPRIEVQERLFVGHTTRSVADLSLAPGELDHLDALGTVRLDVLLQEAVRTRNVEAACSLLDAGADPNGIGGGRGYPLYRAVWSRWTDMVTALLCHGADPNATQQHGNTALMAAVLQGDAATVRVLLGAGADRCSWDMTGRTALDYAIQTGNDDIVRLLDGEQNP